MKNYLITYVYRKLGYWDECWEIDCFEVKADDEIQAREEAAKWGIHQIKEIQELV